MKDRMKYTMGEKFRMLREQAGKSEDDVSRHLKISLPTYIKMEEDFLYPSDQQITVLGRLYGLRYDQVINYAEDV